MASRTQVFLLSLFLASIALGVFAGVVALNPPATSERKPAPNQISLQDLNQAPSIEQVVPEEPARPSFRVNSAMLTVRSAPDRKSQKVRLLRNGQIVEKFGQSGRWIKIGPEQYVSSTYLQPVETTSHH